MNNKGRLKEIINILKECNIMSDHSPENVRHTIESLGPTFVKIGQILSTRVDLLPMNYCDELSKLRSEVTPMPYSDVIEILNNAYPNKLEDMFLKLEEAPVGSASIAEVHKAILKNGKNVVIKIKRKNIENELETDINLLKEAVRILHLNSFIKIIDLEAALDQIYVTTKEELDFKKETENIITYYNNNREDDSITSPFVYQRFTTENTIIMENIQGIKLSEINSLREKYDVPLIARIISDNYIKQAIDDGLFHADPHSDNIMLTDDKIVFIDWGMVGKIKEKNRGTLKTCMKQIIDEDYQGVVLSLMAMSTKTNEVSIPDLTNDVRQILTTVVDQSLDCIDTKAFITDMFNMLRNNNLILDYDVTMLIRGICVLEGALERLDPTISLADVLTRHVVGYEINNINPHEIAKKVGKKIYQSSKSLVNIPTETEGLIKSLKNGDFKFKFEISDSIKQVDKLEQLVHELIIGFIDGCLIVATSNITNGILKTIFVILIIICTAWLFYKMYKDHKHNGY